LIEEVLENIWKHCP